MALVTYEYYTNTYLGEPVAAGDFPRYEARAEQTISAVCRGAYPVILDELTSKGMTQAAQALTTLYSNAICAQIEYFAANGLLAVTAGQSGESFTVGKVSVTAGSAGGSFATRGAAMLAPQAQMLLEQVGLTGRHIAVPAEPFAPFPWEVY